MVSVKYRSPVGWRGESHRHYLAKKGIKTSFSKRYYGNKEDGFIKMLYANRVKKWQIPSVVANSPKLQEMAEARGVDWRSLAYAKRDRSQFKLGTEVAEAATGAEQLPPAEETTNVAFTPPPPAPTPAIEVQPEPEQERVAESGPTEEEAAPRPWRKYVPTDVTSSGVPQVVNTNFNLGVR